MTLSDDKIITNIHSNFGHKYKFNFNQKSLILFFGNKNFNLNHLDENYRFLKQIHSSKIVETSDLLNIEADGHYTRDSGCPLALTTADCLPIYIFNENIIFSLHAGWRGIEKKIILNTYPILLSHKIQPKYLYAFIGPHIQKESFEVSSNIGLSLLNSLDVPSNDLKKLKKKIFFNPKNIPVSIQNKININLSIIAKEQLLSLGILKENIFISNINTFNDNNYYSYRENQTLDRNLSFSYFT